MKPTLLVLAAGMGSRFGGLKQVAGLGPSGETLLEYSVYDAIQAGFGKVVFVIREDIKLLFQENVSSRFEGRIEIEYVCQELSDLPTGFTVPEGRQKPWGTGHAVYVARDLIQEPFVVINADDFYGPSVYKSLANGLKEVSVSDPDFILAAYRLKNTLSEHGSVSRGVCRVGEESRLESIVEHTKIVSIKDGALSQFEAKADENLPLDTLVSMNLFAFTPALFPYLEQRFTSFLKESGTELKSEFYLPESVSQMIHDGKAKVSVLAVEDKWMGVTYADDKAIVETSLKQFVEADIYPSSLWG